MFRKIISVINVINVTACLSNSRENQADIFPSFSFDVSAQTTFYAAIHSQPLAMVYVPHHRELPANQAVALATCFDMPVIKWF